MRVRMNTKIGGYRDGVEWPDPGECLDVPAHEAADLIANGYAKEASDADQDNAGDNDGDRSTAPTGDPAPEGDGNPAPTGEQVAVKPKAAPKARKPI